MSGTARKRSLTLTRQVADAEIWPVAVSISVGVILPRTLPAALGVAAFFWLIRWVARGRPSVRTASDWPLGLLLLTIPVTLWATALPEVTRPQVWQLLAGIALYYAVTNWAASAARLRGLMLGVIGLGLLLAVLAPFTVAWLAGTKLTFIPAGLYSRLPQLLSDPIHPNIMAGALALLWPCAAAAILFSWRQLGLGERALAGLALVAMTLALALTKSRGGLLAVLVALLALCVLRWRRGWLAILIAAAAAGGILWRVGPASLVDMLSATQSLGGLDGRLEVWSRALFMLQDFPFTGIGLGTFKQVANAMYPFFLAGPDAEIPHAHNLFLQVGVDLGLPGLVAWLALFGLACAAAWRVYRWGQADEGGGKPRPDMAGLGAGLLASQIALATHGMLDAATWGTRPAVIVWALWGGAFAAWNLTRAASQDLQGIRQETQGGDPSSAAPEFMV